MFAFKNVRRIRAKPHQQRHEVRTMTKKDFQLLRCLFVQDVIFILFSIPLRLSSAYQSATADKTRTPLQKATDDFFNNFSTVLHHIPYCASFYIFILVSKAFRHELNRMIFKIVGIDIPSIQHEEKRLNNAGRENVELNIAVVTRIEC
ncbi:unnamed protein product [Adineta steineri]|uniref:Uncharacterized protein n=1 Tax=Adineta steineri TaxID=433720 RepID=A0A815LRD4_9BILA|nr:unnamed protein product [Adineta steineri]CAF1477361.1 unnamed protein product [Adineta steineri]CAF3708568.1 unnamed protein product [Adineta steineri]